MGLLHGSMLTHLPSPRVLATHVRVSAPRSSPLCSPESTSPRALPALGAPAHRPTGPPTGFQVPGPAPAAPPHAGAPAARLSSSAPHTEGLPASHGRVGSVCPDVVVSPSAGSGLQGAEARPHRPAPDCLLTHPPSRASGTGSQDACAPRPRPPRRGHAPCLPERLRTEPPAPPRWSSVAAQPWSGAGQGATDPGLRPRRHVHGRGRVLPTS